MRTLNALSVAHTQNPIINRCSSIGPTPSPTGLIDVFPRS